MSMHVMAVEELGVAHVATWPTWTLRFVTAVSTAIATQLRTDVTSTGTSTTRVNRRRPVEA